MSNRGTPRLVTSLDAERLAPAVDQTIDEQDVRCRTMASVGRFASDEAHRLGNLLIALTFCLRQSRGRQRTQELEKMLERGFRDAEQSMEAMRQYVQATRVLLHMSNTKPK